VVISGYSLNNFKGKCLIDFWEIKNRSKIHCPLCRRDINMIIINFSQDEIPANDEESRKIIENVRFYNVCYSKQPRTVEFTFIMI